MIDVYSKMVQDVFIYIVLLSLPYFYKIILKLPWTATVTWENIAISDWIHCYTT